MTQVIFIRHGETVWNTEQRLQGQLNSPLTTLGEKQAAQLAQRLKNHNFSTLYSSDLGRTMQTAQYIADACDKEIKTDQELREHNIGVFQGLSLEEMAIKYPAEWDEYNSIRMFEFIIPEGESRKQCYERSIRVLNKIAEKHPDETVVLVSHGEILRNLIEYILGLEPGGKVTYSRKNAAFNMFNKTDSKWKLEVWGDTSHLNNECI